MKQITLVVLAPAVLSLAGCAGAAWKASATCNTQGVCEAGIEVSGTVANSIVPEPMIKRIARSSVTVDADALSLDLTGSTVGVPNAGLLTVRLVNSATGTTQAAGTFGWSKVGNKLKLTDPDAVNSWALANAGSADTVKYDLHPFPVATASGNNVFKVTQQVEDVNVISSSTSWYRSGPGCSEYYECPAQ